VHLFVIRCPCPQPPEPVPLLRQSVTNDLVFFVALNTDRADENRAIVNKTHVNISNIEERERERETTVKHCGHAAAQVYCAYC